MSRDPKITVATAGLVDGEQMRFDCGMWRCGAIHDGVSCDIGRGGWVIAFADLKRVYEAAASVRADFMTGSAAAASSQTDHARLTGDDGGKAA